MNAKELKRNHIVQIREDGKNPMTCLITDINETSVDVKVINDNTFKELKNVDLNIIFPIDIFEDHVLSLGFKEITNSLTHWPTDIVYHININDKDVYIVKPENDRFHQLVKNANTGDYEMENKLLTLHDLQNELSISENEVDEVSEGLLQKLSQRYQIRINTPVFNNKK